MFSNSLSDCHGILELHAERVVYWPDVHSGGTDKASQVEQGEDPTDVCIIPEDSIYCKESGVFWRKP